MNTLLALILKIIGMIVILFFMLFTLMHTRENKNFNKRKAALFWFKAIAFILYILTFIAIVI